MHNISSLIAAVVFFAVSLGLIMPAQANEDEPDQAVWAGPYLGVLLGEAHHEAEWNEEGNDWWYGTRRTDSDGVYGGLLAGFNLQSDAFVYGVEADFGATSNSAESNFSGGAYDDVVRNELNWISTVRARAGIANEKFFVFATGGWTLADFNTYLQSVGYPHEDYQGSGVRNGWVAGGGLEYRLCNNFVIRADALYHDFGEERYKQPSDRSDIVKISNTVITGRVGFTYYFY